jgi:Tfp pilus assembly protein PilF
MFSKPSKKNGLARRPELKPPLPIAAARAALVLLFLISGCAVKGSLPAPGEPKQDSAAASPKKKPGRRSKEAIRLYNLAQEKLRRGKLPAAGEFLRMAVSADPELFLAHASLGRVLEKSGKKAEAEKAYRRAFELRPGHVKSRVALGRLAFDAGKLEAAIYHLEKAVVLDPESFIAQYCLGLIRRQRRQVALAVHHFKEALRISPDHAAARYWLWLSVSERVGAGRCR